MKTHMKERFAIYCRCVQIITVLIDFLVIPYLWYLLSVKVKGHSCSFGHFENKRVLKCWVLKIITCEYNIPRIIIICQRWQFFQHHAAWQILSQIRIVCISLRKPQIKFLIDLFEFLAVYLLGAQTTMADCCYRFANLSHFSYINSQSFSSVSHFAFLPPPFHLPHRISLCIDILFLVQNLHFSKSKLSICCRDTMPSWQLLLVVYIRWDRGERRWRFAWLWISWFRCNEDDDAHIWWW